MPMHQLHSTESSPEPSAEPAAAETRLSDLRRSTLRVAVTNLVVAMLLVTMNWPLYDGRWRLLLAAGALATAAGVIVTLRILRRSAACGVRRQARRATAVMFCAQAALLIPVCAGLAAPYLLGRP